MMLRILALTVSSLHSDDQAWILGHLGKSEREVVTRLLRDIEALGFNSLAEDQMKTVLQGALSQDSLVDQQSCEDSDNFWVSLKKQSQVLSFQESLSTDAGKSVFPKKLASVLEELC